MRLAALWLVVMTLLGSPVVASPFDEDTYEALVDQAPELEPEVLELAFEFAGCAWDRGESDSPLLSVIDYSLPSTEPRLWVFDLAGRELLLHEWVAHGKNTGANHAKHFSNISGSKQSSLGLFRTGKPYIGRNGYSMRLHGLEEGINDLALERTIVLHGAWYVSDDFIQEQGRLGRSWGCPAVRQEVTRELIDTLQGGSLLFIYYPEESWLENKAYVADCDSDPAASDPAVGAR